MIPAAWCRGAILRPCRRSFGTSFRSSFEVACGCYMSYEEKLSISRDPSCPGTGRGIGGRGDREDDLKRVGRRKGALGSCMRWLGGVRANANDCPTSAGAPSWMGDRL